MFTPAHTVPLLLVGLALAAPAHALTVEIVAPETVRPILNQHLETTRAARLDERMDAEEMARLQRQSESTARELLATEGYFAPTVESAVEWRNGDWHIRYDIQPGPRTTVRSVDLKFAGALVNDDSKSAVRERIRDNFSLPVGAPFRQADWDLAKLVALRPLLVDTYPTARLSASEARIAPAEHAADLSMTVDSGPAFYYGAATVSGTRRYDESVVQNLSPLKPGQPYRQQDLLDYQATLEASPYFAQASVSIDPDPARAAAMPIAVEVVERPEKRFSVGAGVSTDTGARVQAAWLHRNILDRGLRLKFEAKLETSRQTGTAELAWPRNSDGYEHTLGLQLKQEDIEGQKTRSNLLAAKRTRTRGQIETTLAVQYQTETQETGSLTEQNRALTANYGWIQRNVGRAFYPRRGYVLSLQGGGALESLLSDTTFLRLYARHTHYLPVGEQGRLILRAEAGSVLADRREGIPTDFLFRAGGDNSVRGYAYQSLGQTVNGSVTSVRYLATGSVEYNYFFNRNWGMAVFVDAGDAADSPGNLSPVFGYGVGARYSSPVGPINLDLAYGEAVSQFRLHFSLGVSF